jgi:hypothetical protein
MGMFMFATSALARYNPKEKPASPVNNPTIKFREACTTAKARTDQDVNNVRARLLTGGDVWWDGSSDGKYIVPKVEPGQVEVSSLFAGAVWLGGVDPGGNLKVACQTYGTGSNSSDFWPGPIHPETGITSKEVCDKWDQFFEVSGKEIDQHLRMWRASLEPGGPEYTEEMIPVGVKGWPAKQTGVTYFYDVHQFDLPDTDQGLAGFWDEDGDGYYDPLQGDYPIIEIRKCDRDFRPDYVPQYPDEMIFWIYNDEGGGAIHGQTKGIPIRMEVQVQAFGYATNDQINDMTFQRYKLINRAKEDIDSTFFAMWVDPDLGCYTDDYVGCDIKRSLAYTYNADAEDGTTGIVCNQGVPTYGTEIPIVGTDYFRGPLNELREELGMTSFTYYCNGGCGNDFTSDPDDVSQEYYNYLKGYWRDGTPFTYGGSAYNPASTDYIKYAFVDDPDKPLPAWSMCTAALPEEDRRTIQASGPFTLQPGAVNELIIGAVWVPNLDYPCPDITSLLFADDIAQDLFDNCFDLVDGPDAPDVDWIELDREIIAVLTNSSSSNNYLEEYEEPGIGFPLGIKDTTYKFEGYLLYQLAGPNVGPADFSDPTKARLVYWSDVKNNVNTLYNWLPVANPGAELDPSAPDFIFVPEVQIEGQDQGIRHTYRIVEDQFASGDRRLLNHRKYYFSALSYAHNNYTQYDPITQIGQKITYLEGRRNIKTYAVIPRPILDRKLNADFGDGPVVTRIDGVGVGGNFVDMSNETKASILNGSFNDEIVYKNGRGPINVSIFNPLEVKNGEFEVTFVDENMGNNKLDQKVYWQFKDLNGGGPVIRSDQSIDVLNEQIFGEYGFTINIGQTSDVGDWTDPTDGAIGYELEYADKSKSLWFTGVPDGFAFGSGGTLTLTGIVFDFVRHKDKWLDRDHEVLATIGQGFFLPYQICDWETRPENEGSFYLSPAWKVQGSLVNDEGLLKNLNNVDIVFTPVKDYWSRCVVVEAMLPEYTQLAAESGEPITSQGGVKQFDLRAGASVGKDGAPDGDGFGMSWFPGYAIDVETGKRLNIFFGENSAYSAATGYVNQYDNGQPNGADMIFNPTSQILWPDAPGYNPLRFFAGGQHYIYVTTEKYDSCAYHRQRLDPSQTQLRKVNALKRITWTGLPLLQTGQRLLPILEGLIPNEATVKLRVNNPYAVEVGTGDFNGYPTYRFKIEGKQADPLDKVGIENALDKINVVPNPYYAFSDYEDSRLSNVVKITNLPAKCTVTIYTLDGKFIRQYKRDEQPRAPNGNAIPNVQIIPDLEWDLKNSKGIPIAAGVYLIHVDAPEYGERTLKWFGINRQFDPTGL